MSDKKIAFAGVGLMGHGMAQNLLKAGYHVTVIAHRNRKPIDDLVNQGATEVSSPAALAQAGSIIMLCLNNSDSVETVIAAMRPHLIRDQVIIDLGTSRPHSNRSLAADLARDGVHFAESPVTGGPEQARNGELGAMVGSNSQTFKRIKPILNSFCARISHFGPAGAGQTAKLINNYLVCGMIALIIETYKTAAVADIDWQKLFDVMQLGSNNSGALRKIIAPALQGDFDGYQFSIDNAAKDVGYYAELIDELSASTPLAAQVQQIFTNAVDHGQGSEMVSRLLAPSN